LRIVRHLAILGLWLLAAAALVSCEGDDGSGGDDLGRPCAYDGDCGGDLVCDFHMGLGTCQEDHGHSSGGDSSGDSEGDSSSTG
jgi:hypothetical protein